MKFDYFVYGRGVQQQCGYELAHAPSYISMKVIEGLQKLYEIHCLNVDLKKDVNAWEKSFMYLPINKLGCCILVRTVRIKSVETGEFENDFQNRPRWSLEGICCTLENESLFLACLPSVILWLNEHQRYSLYNMMCGGIISDVIEIPDDKIFNPYIKEDVRAFMEGAEQNPCVDEALKGLFMGLWQAGVPSSFFYGPLAPIMKAKIGGGYRIGAVFTGAENTFSDNFAELYTVIGINDRMFNPKQISVTPYIRLYEKAIDKKSTENTYSWELQRSDNSSKRYLCTKEKMWEPEEGISVLELLSEHYGVMNFAKKMNWQVPELSDDSSSYVFIMEE